MLYFEEEKNIEWEKPTIKRNLVSGRGRTKGDYSNSDKVKFVRALLGLAELYEFPQRRAKVNIQCYDPNGSPRTLIEREVGIKI